MDKAIVTILLLVAGVVCSLVVFNAVYPAINRGSAAIITMSSNIDDRIKSQIETVQVSGQTTSSNVYVWVKNVGASRIVAIDRCDVFFALEGTFSRIPYGGGSPPYWDYVIEGDDTEWGPTATVKITIHLSSAPESGTYLVKVVIPNGVSDEHQFSI